MSERRRRHSADELSLRRGTTPDRHRAPALRDEDAARPRGRSRRRRTSRDSRSPSPASRSRRSLFEESFVSSMADIAEVMRRATSSTASRSSFRPKPISYNGKTDYNLFQAQFRMIARTEDWSDERKGRELARCLTDDALEVFLRLPESSHADFTALDSALSTSFGRAYNRREHARRLHEARQLATQSLREFARSIEQQGLLAYKEYPEHIRQEHMIDAFVHGLHDPFVRALLQREDFATLYEALEAAERTVPPDSTKRARATNVDVAAVQPHTSVPGIDALLAKIDSLEKRLQQQTASDQTSDRPPIKYRKTAEGQTASRRDGVVCYNCGMKNHYKSECRQRPKEGVTCSKCNQVGHYNRLCRQSARVASATATSAEHTLNQQPLVFQLVPTPVQDTKPNVPTKPEAGNF